MRHAFISWQQHNIDLRANAYTQHFQTHICKHNPADKAPTLHTALTHLAWQACTPALHCLDMRSAVGVPASASSTYVRMPHSTHSAPSITTSSSKPNCVCAAVGNREGLAGTIKAGVEASQPVGGVAQRAPSMAWLRAAAASVSSPACLPMAGWRRPRALISETYTSPSQ